MTASNKRLRARQMPPEQRKQQLLELAVKAFASKGVNAAKHADVARAANISVPAVFTYFPTRQALEQEVLSFVGDYILNNLFTMTAGLDDLKARLYANGMTWVNEIEQHPDYIKVWLMWGHHFSSETSSLYVDYENRLIQRIIDMIYQNNTSPHDSQQQQDIARMLLGSASMAAQLSFRGESRSRLELFVEHVISNFKL